MRRLVAIVTGTAFGIGRSTAFRLTQDGARVFAVDLSAAGLDDLAADGNGAIVALPGDITAPAMPAEIVERIGAPVDVLANVAGVMDSFLAAAEADDSRPRSASLSTRNRHRSRLLCPTDSSPPARSSPTSRRS